MLNFPSGQCSGELFVLGRERGIELDARAVCRRDRHHDGLGGDLAAIRPHRQVAARASFDTAHDGVQMHTRVQFLGHPQRDLLGAAGEAVLLGAAFDVEHAADPACGLDVAHGVHHRHVLGLTPPRHPGHDRHQISCRRAGVHVPQPLVEGLGVQDLGERRRPRFVDRHPPADPVESPLDARHIDQLDDRQLGNGAAIRPDLAAPSDQVLAARVGWLGLAAQLLGQRKDGVLSRADECAAEVDRRAGDRRAR